MIHEFSYKFEDCVAHRHFPSIAGPVIEMSIDSNDVEWVRIARVCEGKLDTTWIAAVDVELVKENVGFGAVQ